jgi:hypothetical protein
MTENAYYPDITDKKEGRKVRKLGERCLGDQPRVIYFLAHFI